MLWLLPAGAPKPRLVLTCALFCCSEAQVHLMRACNGHAALPGVAAVFLPALEQAVLDWIDHSVRMLASQFTWSDLQLCRGILLWNL